MIVDRTSAKAHLCLSFAGARLPGKEELVEQANSISCNLILGCVS